MNNNKSSSTYMAPDLERDQINAHVVRDELLKCLEIINREFIRILDQPTTDKKLKLQTKEFLTSVFHSCGVSFENPNKEGIVLALELCKKYAKAIMGPNGKHIIDHHYAEMMKLVSKLNEKEVRLLCIRAGKQYLKSSDISAQEKIDAERLFKLLSTVEAFGKISNNPALCRALSAYLRSLKTTEKFMISDPMIVGFDGAKPLLVALNKEIDLTLESKGQLCHDDIPKRLESRIDW